MKHKWLGNIFKYSTLLAISKMQIKTIWDFILPVRMAKTPPSKWRPLLAWLWGKQSSNSRLWEEKLPWPLWTSVWSFLKNLEIDLPFQGIFPKGFISYHRITFCQWLFITAVRKWKQPRPSVDEWIIKMWYVYTKGYYSTINKIENQRGK